MMLPPPLSFLPTRYRVSSPTPMQGGYGNIWAIHDDYLDRGVLFKSMQDKADNAQLLNEIQAISKARSRHVVEIYDVVFDSIGDVAGIVIEHLQGREFSDFHKEASNNPSGFLRILYQIARALSDMHAAGVVHRDIKIENLRESISGVLRIFDFGISSPADGYFTANNRGTLAYAAPELFVAGAPTTPKVDIYALGACAWALASNVWPPVLLETPPQQSGTVPSIASVLAAIPNEVALLIDTCLSRDPSDRPEAHQVANALEKHLVSGQHRGLFIRGQSTIYELSANQKNVGLKIMPFGELQVRYDGISFVVDGVSGSVYVNNQAAVPGMLLHESCVITYGGAEYESGRQFIPFFSSHPEVVL